MLTLDPGTLIALIHGEISVADALASGVLALDGDREAVERFVGLFPLPEPAALPASRAAGFTSTAAGWGGEGAARWRSPATPAASVALRSTQRTSDQRFARSAARNAVALVRAQHEPSLTASREDGHPAGLPRIPTQRS